MNDMMLIDTNTASQRRANHPPNLKHKAWDLSAGVSTLNVYRPPTPPLSELGLEFAESVGIPYWIKA